MIKINLQFFGGRGASSASGGGGGSATGELVLPDGSKIEFEGELTFGGDDPNVSGTARKVITDFEKKRAGAKVEFAYAVDADGNPIGKEKRGGSGSVRAPYEFHATQDAVFSHNHPRGDGMLSGTFSDADLRNFRNFGNKTCRAVGKEGTYSISKGKGFDRAGFGSYVSSSFATSRSEYTSKHNALANQYKAGKISYDSYLKGAAKEFNTYLVRQHKILSDGQKQFGYTYTLERS